MCGLSLTARQRRALVSHSRDHVVEISKAEHGNRRRARGPEAARLLAAASGGRGGRVAATTEVADTAELKVVAPEQVAIVGNDRRRTDA